jgi:hypothetical protein
MLAPAQAGESPKFRFTLEQGDFAGQAFTATLLICDSPCCGCDGVRFYCQPAAEPRDPSEPALVSPAPLHVDLSVMQGKGDPRPEATRKDLALTRAIVAELQPSEWKQWEQVFLDTKRGLMQTMDLAKIDARFPPEVMEGSSTTVGYLEVFPWADSFPFTLGAEMWLAEDVYCVDPDCDCQGAVLEIFRSRSSFRRGKRPLRFDSVLRHDYVRGRTTQLDRKHGSPATTELMAALRAAHASFEQTLKKRHQQLRQIGRRLMAAEVPGSRPVAYARTKADAAEPPSEPPTPPVKAAAKVGRNDPCPCGSGKKFKNCCDKNVGVGAA